MTILNDNFILRKHVSLSLRFYIYWHSATVNSIDIYKKPTFRSSFFWKSPSKKMHKRWISRESTFRKIWNHMMRYSSTNDILPSLSNKISVTKKICLVKPQKRKKIHLTVFETVWWFFFQQKCKFRLKSEIVTLTQLVLNSKSTKIWLFSKFLEFINFQICKICKINKHSIFA